MTYNYLRFLEYMKTIILISIKVVFVFNLTITGCIFNDNPLQYDGSDFRDYEFVEPIVTGNTYYIDPVNGSPDGNGSAEHPWFTLQQVIDSNLIECYRHTEAYNPNSELEIVNKGAPIRGGDRLLLRIGYHGYVKRNYFIFKDWLTIEAEEGHTPILSHFRCEGTFENIYLKNLTILKESYQGDEEYWQAEVINRNSSSCIYFVSSLFWGEGSHIKLNGLTVKTAENTAGWRAADWVEKAASGISLRSVKHVEIVNCTLENVRHGMAIEYHSDHSFAVNNTINNYSADGCRLISNHVLFAYNTITNCYDVNENHDDAIQSYSRGVDNSSGTGVLHNVVIRGNLIIGTPDRNNPLAGNPQGIGCFDGFYDDWIVENNLVITDHYHGISFYGMRNSKIVNNTVIDEVPDNDTVPWIYITDHKNGTPSENCYAANNIASSHVSGSGDHVEIFNNFVIGRNNHLLIYKYFVDPDKFDFHLLDNDSTRKNIINKGNSFKGLLSSRIDMDKIERKGKPDIGAYELND